MQQSTQHILNIFENFRMAPTAIDEYQEKGKSILADKIDTFTANNRTIDFVMLGYPMKSKNIRDKVIGSLPDLAEEVSLRNFDTFNSQIKKVYAPGVNIHIVSDGFAFNKTLDVPDTIVEQYEEISKEMSKNFAVTWYDMRSFYDRALPTDSMRAKVIEQFGITPEQLQERILFSPDVNYLYRGMIHFMEEELAMTTFPSRNQQQKAAKKLVREMMLMNEAYSNLIAQEFKSYVRLSMHPSINDGHKYSFQLIPGKKAWTSPWHCALLIDEVGEYATVHRKDAEAAGHQLIYKDGRPYYFESVQNYFYER